MPGVAGKVCWSRALGAYLSHDRITATEVGATLAGTVVLNRYDVPVDEDGPGEALKKLLEQRFAPRRRKKISLVLGIGAEQTFFTTRRVHGESQAEAPTPAQLLAASGSAGAWDISQTLADCIPAKALGKQVYSVAACRRELGEMLQGILQQIGVKHYRLEPGPWSVLEAAERQAKSRKWKLAIRVLLEGPAEAKQHPASEPAKPSAPAAESQPPADAPNSSAPTAAEAQPAPEASNPSAPTAAEAQPAPEAPNPSAPTAAEAQPVPEASNPSAPTAAEGQPAAEPTNPPVPAAEAPLSAEAPDPTAPATEGQPAAEPAKPHVPPSREASGGLALLAVENQPVLWRRFTVVSGREAVCIASAVRSLLVYAVQYLGVRHVGGIVLHGPVTKELAEEVSEESGMEAVAAPGEGLSDGTYSLGLALSARKQARPMDLLRSMSPPPSIREIFPWRLAGFICLAAGAMALMMLDKASRLAGDCEHLARQNASSKWAADMRTNAIDRECKQLTAEVGAVSKFVGTRIIWSEYLRDLPTRIPPNACMASLWGACDMQDMSKKKQQRKSNKSLTLRCMTQVAPEAAVPDEASGGSSTVPREIDAFLESLRNVELLKRDFPLVSLAEIKWRKDAGGDVASFTVVALPKEKPAAGGEEE